MEETTSTHKLKELLDAVRLLSQDLEPIDVNTADPRRLLGAVLEEAVSAGPVTIRSVGPGDIGMPGLPAEWPAPIQDATYRKFWVAEVESREGGAIVQGHVAIDPQGEVVARELREDASEPVRREVEATLEYAVRAWRQRRGLDGEAGAPAPSPPRPAVVVDNEIHLRTDRRFREGERYRARAVAPDGSSAATEHGLRAIHETATCAVLAQETGFTPSFLRAVRARGFVDVFEESKCPRMGVRSFVSLRNLTLETLRSIEGGEWDERMAAALREVLP